MSQKSVQSKNFNSSCPVTVIMVQVLLCKYAIERCLIFHLTCLVYDGRDAARRADPSAAAETCLQPWLAVSGCGCRWLSFASTALCSPLRVTLRYVSHTLSIYFARHCAPTPLPRTQMERSFRAADRLELLSQDDVNRQYSSRFIVTSFVPVRTL